MCGGCSACWQEDPTSKRTRASQQLHTQTAKVRVRSDVSPKPTQAQGRTRTHTQRRTHAHARTRTHIQSCCFTYSYRPMAEQTPLLLMCRQPACRIRMRARGGRHSHRTRARARRVRSAAFGMQTNSDGEERDGEERGGRERGQRSGLLIPVYSPSPPPTHTLSLSFSLSRPNIESRIRHPHQITHQMTLNFSLTER